MSLRARMPHMTAAIMSIVLLATACESGFSLTVENRGSQPVQVFVDGARLGSEQDVLPACSKRTYGTILFGPGKPLDVEVRDMKGATLVKDRPVDSFKERGLARATVSVPSSNGNPCVEPLVVVEPSPVSKEKLW